jgi:hypothetical protein
MIVKYEIKDKDYWIKNIIVFNCAKHDI